MQWWAKRHLPLASPNVQLDTFVLRGLTDVSTDWQFGLGLSARLLP